jgi:hypothetical protein
VAPGTVAANRVSSIERAAPVSKRKRPSGRRRFRRGPASGPRRPSTGPFGRARRGFEEQASTRQIENDPVPPEDVQPDDSMDAPLRVELFGRGRGQGIREFQAAQLEARQQPARRRRPPGAPAPKDDLLRQRGVAALLHRPQDDEQPRAPRVEQQADLLLVRKPRFDEETALRSSAERDRRARGAPPGPIPSVLPALRRVESSPAPLRRDPGPRPRSARGRP